MTKKQVSVSEDCKTNPDEVWAVARDFSAAWHPFIDTSRIQKGEGGALIRAFTVKGENTLYREQLSYFSDTDRTLSYTLLEGIEGVEFYSAGLSVSPAAGGGSTITMTASLEAPSPRAGEIAAATKFVFEAGARALADGIFGPKGPTASRPFPSSTSIETCITGNSPALAISKTPRKDGPLCLFLHGIGGNRNNWTPQLEAVGGIVRCASLDLRGYGDSQPGNKQTTVDDYCADILSIREALGTDKLILCGLSYGSWIATSFAMRYPELLDGLILSGGCTGMSEAGQEEREAFRNSRIVPLDAGKVPADLAPGVVEVIAGPHASGQVRASLSQSMELISAATYRDALNCFTHPTERFDFAKLAMPVLMLTGEFDRLAPPDEIRGVAIRITASAPLSDVRFEVIQRAGHVCNVEEPDQFNSHLIEFLTRVSA